MPYTTSRGLQAPTATETFQPHLDMQRIVDGVNPLLPTFHTSGVLAGSAPSAGTTIIMKQFVGTVTFSVGGDYTITYPGGAFANGLVGLQATCCTQSPIWLNCWGYTLTLTNVRGLTASGTAASLTFPISVTAWGW